MQIIKPTLGIQTSLLGAVNFLGIPYRLSLKKESDFNLRSPLINYSKLLLPRQQHKSLINLDVWNTDRHDDGDFDISTNILPIEFTAIDAIPEQNYTDNTDIGINTIVNNILPEPVKNNNNINNSLQLNDQKKSKSKKTTKSTKSQAKSKPKAKPKAKSKKEDQSLNEINTIIHIDDDRRIEAPNLQAAESEPDKIRLKEIPQLPEQETTSRYITTQYGSDQPEKKPGLSKLPLIEPDCITTDCQDNSPPSVPTLSQVQDKPIVLGELANNYQLITSEQVTNSPPIPNSESNISDNLLEKSTPQQQNVYSKTTINKSQDNTSFISTNQPHTGETSTLLSHANDEQLVLEPLVIPPTEVSEEISISDIPTNSTPQRQNTNLDLTTNQLQKSTPYPSKPNSVEAEQPTILRHLSNDIQQVTPEFLPEASTLINPTPQQQDIELDNITSQISLQSIIQPIAKEPAQKQQIISEDSLNVSSSPVLGNETSVHSKLHSASSRLEGVYNEESASILTPATLQETTQVTGVGNPLTQEFFLELSSPSQNATSNELLESVSVPPAATADTSTLLRIRTNEHQTLSIASNPEISEEVHVSQISKSPTPQKQDTKIDSTKVKLQESIPVISTSNLSDTEDKPTGLREFENEKQIEASEIAVVPPKISDNIHVSDIPGETQATQPDGIPNLSDISQQNGENTSPTEALQNTVEIPAPVGFATGGLVAASYSIDNPQIAPSDTVPAMLTPGEFVINARDAQQNLNILRHLNSGGTLPEDVISPIPTPEPKEREDTAAIKPTTKVDTFKQTAPQENVNFNLPTTQNLLVSPSPDLGIRNQGIATDSSLQFNTFANPKTGVRKNSNHYSSPPLVFRQKDTTNNTNTPNAPSEWSSVEELLNGSTDVFTIFNLGEVESSKQNLEYSPRDESPKIFAKQYFTQGFADGGEVTATDISTDIEPITETIERPPDSEEKSSPDLETLAREVYHRLRQRLEIERERHGIHLGRLPW